MTKPEGISDEAWEKANGCFPGNSWNPLSVERVARAIQSSVEAERARTADIADKGVKSPGDDAWAKGYRCASADIATSIRFGV